MPERRPIEIVSVPARDGEEDWFDVGSAGSVPVGGAVVVPLDPPIAVFNVDGELLATDDTCTHSKSSLGLDGYISGDTVECAWHLATFCIRTGAALTAPARRDLHTHRVVIADDRILVGVRGRRPSKT